MPQAICCKVLSVRLKGSLDQFPFFVVGVPSEAERFQEGRSIIKTFTNMFRQM